jgi:hypothetical protein
MISRPWLQVIEFVQRDGMNGLIRCLWHHLVYGPTKIKKVVNASTIAFMRFLVYNAI